MRRAKHGGCGGGFATRAEAQTSRHRLTVLLQYLDRNAIALAKLSSIEADLGLSDTQYQTAVSILFVSSCSAA